MPLALNKSLLHVLGKQSDGHLRNVIERLKAFLSSASGESQTAEEFISTRISHVTSVYIPAMIML